MLIVLHNIRKEMNLPDVDESDDDDDDSDDDDEEDDEDQNGMAARDHFAETHFWSALVLWKRLIFVFLNMKSV